MTEAIALTIVLTTRAIGLTRDWIAVRIVLRMPAGLDCQIASTRKVIALIDDSTVRVIEQTVAWTEKVTALIGD
jgi:hypothetical protein